MAKYDHGGGCACGLYSECICKEPTEQKMSQVYRHRSGELYTVLEDNALFEATTKRAVIYQSLADGRIWIREHSNFFEPGRFTRLSQEELKK